jgi:hypothetical protein
MAGVPTVAALSDDFPGALLDVRHRVGECHEVERGLSLVATLGHRLPADDDGRVRLRAPSATAGAAAIALREAGFEVVVTGGPDEVALTAEVAAAAGALDLGGRTSLAKLAELYASAAVVCCGNTGPGHLAAAVGTPVVVAFAPTVPPQRWRPWGVPHALLGDLDVPCAGCRPRRGPLPEQACLTRVRPVDVVSAVRRVLSDPDLALPPTVALAVNPAVKKVAS